MAKYILYHVPCPIYSQWLTLATSDSERKSATATSVVPAVAKAWGLAGSVEHSYGRHCTLVKLPPSMGFSRQEYWSGVPLPSPEDLPNPGIKLGSPAL